jgi:hypothetical protein
MATLIGDGDWGAVDILGYGIAEGKEWTINVLRRVVAWERVVDILGQLILGEDELVINFLRLLVREEDQWTVNVLRTLIQEESCLALNALMQLVQEENKFVVGALIQFVHERNELVIDVLRPLIGMEIKLAVNIIKQLIQKEGKLVLSALGLLIQGGEKGATDVLGQLIQEEGNGLVIGALIQLIREGNEQGMRILANTIEMIVQTHGELIDRLINPLVEVITGFERTKEGTQPIKSPQMRELLEQTGIPTAFASALSIPGKKGRNDGNRAIIYGLMTILASLAMGENPNLEAIRALVELIVREEGLGGERYRGVIFYAVAALREAHLRRIQEVRECFGETFRIEKGYQGAEVDRGGTAHSLWCSFALSLEIEDEASRDMVASPICKGEGWVAEWMVWTIKSGSGMGLTDDILGPPIERLIGFMVRLAGEGKEKAVDVLEMIVKKSAEDRVEPLGTIAGEGYESAKVAFERMKEKQLKAASSMATKPERLIDLFPK